MKQKVLFVLLNGYADWGAFLSTALHVAVIPDGEIKYEVHTVAPTLDTVRPIGGFRTLPDYSFKTMQPWCLSAATVGILPKRNLSPHW